MNEPEKCQKLIVAIQQTFIKSRLIAHSKCPDGSELLFWNGNGDVGRVKVAFEDVSTLKLTMKSLKTKDVSINENFNINNVQQRLQRFLRDFTGQKKRSFPLSL